MWKAKPASRPSCRDCGIGLAIAATSRWTIVRQDAILIATANMRGIGLRACRRVAAGGAPALAALQQVARRLPIVFANATTRGDGYVARLPGPGATRPLRDFESRFGGNCFELLKQFAPTRRARCAPPKRTSTGIGQMSALRPQRRGRRGADPRLEITTRAKSSVALRHSCTDRMMADLTSQLEQIDREQIVALAAQYRLPAVYASAGMSRKVD